MSIKLGLIGCGGMGRGLAKNATTIEGAEVVALSDPEPEALAKAAETLPGEKFPDYRKLLAQNLDGVFVATPNYTHKEVALAAAAAGKHIFCEKPMALNVADCDAMIAGAQKAGVKLMVGQVLRLIPLFAKVWEIARSGEIGKPICLAIDRVSGYGFGGPWRHKKELSGGLLFEVNVHELDYLRAVCGEVAQVSACGGHYVDSGIDYADVYLINLKFRGGAVGHLFASLASSLGAYDGKLLGDNGAIFYKGWDEIVVKPRDGEERRLEAKTLGLEDGVHWEVRSFVEWIRDGAPPVVTAQDGRAAVELAQAANLSLELGKPVDLPLHGERSRTMASR